MCLDWEVDIKNNAYEIRGFLNNAWSGKWQVYWIIQGRENVNLYKITTFHIKRVFLYFSPFLSYSCRMGKYRRPHILLSQ